MHKKPKLATGCCARVLHHELLPLSTKQRLKASNRSARVRIAPRRAAHVKIIRANQNDRGRPPFSSAKRSQVHSLQTPRRGHPKRQRAPARVEHCAHERLTCAHCLGGTLSLGDVVDERVVGIPDCLWSRSPDEPITRPEHGCVLPEVFFLVTDGDTGTLKFRQFIPLNFMPLTKRDTAVLQSKGRSSSAE